MIFLPTIEEVIAKMCDVDDVIEKMCGMDEECRKLEGASEQKRDEETICDWFYDNDNYKLQL